MRLTVVGCSGSAPAPDAACSCYLVEHDGHRLLLDLGAGACGPLQRYADPADIDAVIMSHNHPDHWSDLVQLGYLRSRVKAPVLPLVGPSTMAEVLTTNPDVFAATVATAAPATVGPIPYRLARLDHGACEAWGTRIGDVLCYTADTGPCDALDELADGCAVLLAEGSGFDDADSSGDEPIGAHLTAGEAGRLATRSGAKLLVLTHLRPWHDHAALLDEAASHASCPVVLARPGLRVSLR